MEKAFDVPCSCEECTANRAAGKPSCAIRVHPIEEIPCNQCHRAAPGKACVFCNGTRVARIAHNEYVPFTEGG